MCRHRLFRLSRHPSIKFLAAERADHGDVTGELEFPIFACDRVHVRYGDAHSVKAA